MRNLGFKIVDQDVPMIEPIVDRAIAENRPLEIGWYYGDRAARALLQKRLVGTSAKVNCHTDHKTVSVADASAKRDALASHVDESQVIGSAYSIVHTARVPVAVRRTCRPALYDELMRQLEVIEGICHARDYAMFVENTFHGLEFYRSWFRRIHRHGLQCIHFCFDIGHAKVWSEASFADWLIFLGELSSLGFRLHFHLHANRGLGDQHWSLMEADACGGLAADADFLTEGFVRALAQITQLYPAAWKIFEVKGELALANMDEAIARLRPFG